MTSYTWNRNGRGWDVIALIILLIALVWLMMSLPGCVTQNKCYKRYPPQVKDSISYVEKVRDTTIYIGADTAITEYLVECQETNEGLRARIVQLIRQQPGVVVNSPSSVITGNVLTTTGTSREQQIKLLVKELHYAAVKSQVYVKVTNELTGWQWAQVWAGRLLMLLVAVYAGFKVLKKYTGIR